MLGTFANYLNSKQKADFTLTYRAWKVYVSLSQHFKSCVNMPKRWGENPYTEVVLKIRKVNVFSPKKEENKNLPGLAAKTKARGKL